MDFKLLASASFFFFKFQFLLIRTGIFQLLVPWMFSLHLIQCSPYPSVGNNLINGLRLCQIKQIFSLKKKKRGRGNTGNKFLSSCALTSFHLFPNCSSKGKVQNQIGMSDHIRQSLTILFSFHLTIWQQNSTAGSRL